MCEMCQPGDDLYGDRFRRLRPTFFYCLNINHICVRFMVLC
jgi:hypothetical protein